MDRYEELERLYYKKKYIKIFIYILILVSLLSIGIFIYIQNKHLKNPKKQALKIEKNITKEKNNTKKIITQKLELNKSKQKLEKSKKIKPEVKKLTLYPIFPEINITKQIQKRKSRKIEKTKKIEKPKKVQSPQPQIKIIIKSQKQTLQSLVNAYNISPDYAQAIKIAKIYFNKQNYKKTIEWSKKANQIEPENPISWLLFAKSLIKLGKSKKAKEVLIAYLNTYGAEEDIEKLLRSIK